MTFQKGQSGNPAARFLPGQSGNPAGKPRTRPITDALKEILEMVDPKSGRPVGDLVAAKLVEAVMKTGNPKMAALILDRVEGKVKEQLEHSGGVTIQVVPFD